ncbi:F-box protein CPR1-like [Apium graveolens]|uniref:F-box protein CPR1-like n=1 Tax=Apium graveolens TaxID=4045 RepID=UPI003D7A64B9
MSTYTTNTLGQCTEIPHIPDELVNDVLLRLPVKPLLCFRCVRKSWCSLIDSTTFVKNHLERNSERNPHSGLIFVSMPKRNNFYLADADSLNGSTAIKITKPLKSKLSGAKIVGSCNGLVCSYDHLNDDYKVVRISERLYKGVKLSVYSLRSNSWTRPRTLRHLICLYRPGTFVDGSLYWLSSYKGYNIIVAFDLADEKFTEVPYPRDFDWTTVNKLLLLVFNRRLCLISFYSKFDTDIWLMNNCGVENSWSKMFSGKNPGILWVFTYLAAVASPILHSEISFEVRDSKFSWFDREKNEFGIATLYGLPAMVAP